MAHRVPHVLHVLPHRGGGAETYIDLLEEIEGFHHTRLALALDRRPVPGLLSAAARYPLVLRRARAAHIVHAHGDVAALLAQPLLARQPSVWTTHGLHFLRRAEGPASQGAKRGLTRVIAAAGHTLCTSETEREELLALAGPYRGRVMTVRNGIDLPAPVQAPARAQARAQLGLDEGELAVLFLGELEQRKRPLDAAAAAAAAGGRGAPVVLLVAGEGPQAAELRERAGPAVRVLGYRRDRDRLLAASDVLVLPSEREGLSFALLEAMGAGLAPVVSDGPGNAEAVGDAGIVFGLGDVDALAGVLERLAAQPLDVRRRGHAARRLVATTLTATGMRDAVAGAYRDVLGASA